MKRYISAILVPCLLIQLYGCYSFRGMTLKELKNFTDQDDIIIKANQTKFLINRKSNEIGSMNWEANDSSIIVKTKAQLTLEDYNKLHNQDYSKSTNKEMEIKYNEIESVEIDDFNITRTVLLLTGIGAIVLLCALAGSAPGAIGF